MMIDKSNFHGKASGALFSSGTEDRAREGRRRRGRGDRVPAPASTRTFFFARPSATSRLFHSPMRAWGGRSAGACAPRARVWGRARSAAARHASARLRFLLDRRGVGRARARKKGGSRRGRIQFAPTPPVYPRHASPKWAAITGAANATDTGCVARDPEARGLLRHAAPRRSRDPASSTSSDPSARRESTSRALDRRPVALVTSFPLTTSSPVFSHTLHASYTRCRMAVTTAAAAAAGSALPR